MVHCRPERPLSIAQDFRPAITSEKPHQALKGRNKTVVQNSKLLCHNHLLNYIHVIFPAKQRQPFIPIRFENEIHRYFWPG
jgi:hypothetical protein